MIVVLPLRLTYQNRDKNFRSKPNSLGKTTVPDNLQDFVIINVIRNKSCDNSSCALIRKECSPSGLALGYLLGWPVKR